MKRKYSLFGKKEGERRWTQLSQTALPKEQAIWRFQNTLLRIVNQYPEYTILELRPVKAPAY